MLLPLHAAGCSGEARLPWRRPAMLWERFCLILSGLFGDLRAGFLTLGSVRGRRWDGRKAAGILFGCAGALVLLALLVPALLRADALFANEMGTLFTWELPELRFPRALAISLMLTPFACSLLWRLSHPREGKTAAEHAPWLPPVCPQPWRTGLSLWRRCKCLRPFLRLYISLLRLYMSLLRLHMLLLCLYIL